MGMLAYIDESFSPPDGTYVLGGHIATSESWRVLSTEWEKLLPLTERGQNGEKTYGFKMKEMLRSEKRQRHIPTFYALIQKHALCSITCTLKMRDLKKAQERIISPKVDDWGPLNHHYYIAFRALMDMFHTYKERAESVIPTTEKVDFIFDEVSQKDKILGTWDRYIKNRPDHVRQHFGAIPQFKKDNECLPLQAADLWVGWVRKCIEDGTPEKIKTLGMSADKKRQNLHIDFNEDAILKGLVSEIQGIIGAQELVCCSY
jgi:hypothetical protein